MPMTTYESKIKTIAKSQEFTFNFLSDFSFLEKIKDQPIAGDEKLNNSLKDLEFDKDSIKFKVTGFGQMGLRIIQREPFKTIKMEAEDSPVKANAWIQFVGVSENETKMRITLKADIPLALRMMVGSKIEKGINTLADAIAKGLSEMQ